VRVLGYPTLSKLAILSMTNLPEIVQEQALTDARFKNLLHIVEVIGEKIITDIIEDEEVHPVR
jgi:hypothetical protein